MSWSCWSRLWINWTAPVITCVVSSPTLWMVRCRRLTSHEVRSTGLNWDGTCLHNAEDVSYFMMSTLLPTDVFQLVDSVSLSRQWKNQSKITHHLCCWVSVGVLALSPRALQLLVVALGCWTLKCGSTIHGCFPPWEFTGSLWSGGLDFFTKWWYWTLSYWSSLRSNPCSVERR